jgi:ABC-type uncharacterized transport system permease subunit
MRVLARELLFPLIAVVAAFVVGGILILLIGDNPIVASRLMELVIPSFTQPLSFLLAWQS